MEVHNHLGSGFLEIVYKDALEYEFQKAKIPFEREKEYVINYHGIILRRKFYSDFVVFDKIILCVCMPLAEVKAVSGISDDFMALAINYLNVSINKLAIIVNFGEAKFKHKR